jgi:RHS repeat-associated protein
VDQGDANVFFQHNHYQYDKAGREVATWRDEDGSKGERFWYNAADHLTRVVYKANNVWTENPTGWERFRDYNYTPDLLNWTSVNDNGYLSVRASNAMNQYTNVNSFVPGYDGNFNETTNYHGQTFIYNAANQVVGGSIQATYDGLGRCVRRTVGGVTTLFTYDNWNPILEWDQGGNQRARNIYGAKADEILGRYDAIYGPLIYKQDKRGNVTFLLDGANRVIEKYTYDAFGRPAVTSWNYQTSAWKAPSDRSSFGNRFMFTGREWLAEINAYDYRHRLYYPDVGRFLQTDPLGLQTEGVKLSAGQKALFSPGFQAPEAFTSSELNLYRYCGDDPVDGSDPLGLHDINLLPRDEEASKWADKAPLSKDRITIIGHGTQISMIDSNGEDLPVSKLAAIIRDNPKFDGKKPVVLDACETGKSFYDATKTKPRSESYAQKLANELGVPVKAPTGKPVIDSGGKVTLDAKKGYYRTIIPQKDEKSR